MANYNTFVVVDCNTRKPFLTTSSAKKANKELKTGVRIEVWNNNVLVERIYESDRCKEPSPLSAYIRAEREYIARKQAEAEKRNKRRKAARLARQK